SGPYRTRAGHDLNYQAMSGVLDLTRGPDGRPLMPGMQLGDLGGGVGAIVAVLAAVHARDATGEGQHCDVSMVDGLVSWLAIHAARFFATGAAPAPGHDTLMGRHP